jgi:alcohol dehydrogenase (NADP+)
MASSTAPPAVPTHFTLSNGQRMPALGFGTWRCDVALLEGALLEALRLGYRHIDTGPYKNEAIVGRALKEAIARGYVAARSDVWITGKLPTTASDPAAVAPTLRTLLAELQVDYLDLYMTHWPYALDPGSVASPPLPECRRGYSPAAYLATWRALEACVDAGLVRSLGASNMSARKLAALLPHARIAPVVVQNELHPALAAPRLLAFAAAHGILLSGYCPLGSPGRPALYRAPGDPDVLGDPRLLAVAAACARTPAQVALRWALQRGTAPLPRTTTLARVGENWGALAGDWHLTPQHMATLAEMDATAGSVGRIMKGVRVVVGGVGASPLGLVHQAPSHRTHTYAHTHTLRAGQFRAAWG